MKRKSICCGLSNENIGRGWHKVRGLHDSNSGIIDTGTNSDIPLETVH